MSAINALRLGSYSILSTVPILSNVFLLKLIILYFFLWPPDLCLIVIFPVLFLPEWGCNSSTRFFSGLPLNKTDLSIFTVFLKEGVVGLYVIRPISILPFHSYQ